MQKLDYSVYVIQFYKKAQSMQKLRVTAVSLAPGCSRGQTMPFNNNNNNNKVNLYTRLKAKSHYGRRSLIEQMCISSFLNRS